MALPTPPKLGQKICHHEVAFLQVPARHSHGAGSRGWGTWEDGCSLRRGARGVGCRCEKEGTEGLEEEEGWLR